MNMIYGLAIIDFYAVEKMTNRTTAHREADSRYSANKRHIKPVSFNTTNAQDIERLNKLKQIPNFTEWVKSKIDELP